MAEVIAHRRTGPKLAAGRQRTLPGLGQLLPDYAEASPLARAVKAQSRKV
jgi:hypothetical protein